MRRCTSLVIGLCLLAFGALAHAQSPTLGFRQLVHDWGWIVIFL